MSHNGTMPNPTYDKGMNMQTAQQNPFHQSQNNAFGSYPLFTYQQNQFGMHTLNQMNTPLPPQFQGMNMSPYPL